jgi:hypothetical protein
MSAEAPSLTPTSATATTWAPNVKVTFGVFAAALVTLFVPLLKKWIPSLDTAQGAAAATTALTFVIQYLIPEPKAK